MDLVREEVEETIDALVGEGFSTATLCVGGDRRLLPFLKLVCETLGSPVGVLWVSASPPLPQ